MTEGHRARSYGISIEDLSPDLLRVRSKWVMARVDFNLIDYVYIQL